MPSLRDLLPTRFELPTAHRPLMAFAAIVAASLLAFYVHLLHESMALGEQMRERQRSATSIGLMKAVAQRPATQGSPARNGADVASARSR